MTRTQLIRNMLWLVSLVLLIFVISFTYRTGTLSRNLSAVPVQDAQITVSQQAREAREIEATKLEVKEAAKKAEAEKQERLAAEAEETAILATVSTSESIESEGAPEGYVGFPPRCGILWNITPPYQRTSFPWKFQVSRDYYQTLVEITRADFYLNGKLVQSSTSDTYSFTALDDGEYTLKASIDTNFGPAFDNPSCEVQITIPNDMLVP